MTRGGSPTETRAALRAATVPGGAGFRRSPFAFISRIAAKMTWAGPFRAERRPADERNRVFESFRGLSILRMVKALVRISHARHYGRRSSRPRRQQLLHSSSRTLAPHRSEGSVDDLGARRPSRWQERTRARVVSPASASESRAGGGPSRPSLLARIDVAAHVRVSWGPFQANVDRVLAAAPRSPPPPRRCTGISRRGSPPPRRRAGRPTR
jgi:hypothetical protein